MPSVLVRIILFLSSYVPLFIVFTLNSAIRSTPAAYALWVLAVISVAVLVLYLKTMQRSSADAITVVRMVPRDSETMSYIVTYLLPFMSINFRDTSTAVALAMTFVVVGILYVNSNMLYINPILSLAGFHLFEIETSEQTTAMLLCRRRHVPPGTRLRVVMLTPYILMEHTQ